MSDHQGTEAALSGLPEQRGLTGAFDLLGKRHFSCPWPQLDPVLDLGPGRLVGIGAYHGRREAVAGLDIALHTAANGHNSVLFAPELPARNNVPNLRIERGPEPTPDRIRETVTNLTALRQRPEVVVVDDFTLLRLDPPTHHTDAYDPWDDPDDEDELDPAVREADEIGRQLKLLATHHDLAVVVMAHITPPFNRTTVLTTEHLGLAASLEYDADVLLLLRRTDARRVDVHVAKNRNGPTPHHFTADW
ncbi:hypothetical protein ACFWP2_29250 [Kitasatospora sp. NPDC058444]|uniref:hypothetical protein n=1 Tax=Kitasatospora sp. NPDC058444 TaxID=3346504 RepID=UPI00364D4B2C